MAVRTLGTSANNSLSAMAFLHGIGSMTPADVATINNGIKSDNAAQQILGGFSPADSMLYVPRRGVLKVRAGDYVAIDTTTGWPILISSYAIANGPWSHS